MHLSDILPPVQQSHLLVANRTGSLPRNLAATLQDIETKRQLALQQKGDWPGFHFTKQLSTRVDAAHRTQRTHTNKKRERFASI